MCPICRHIEVLGDTLADLGHGQGAVTTAPDAARRSVQLMHLFRYSVQNDDLAINEAGNEVGSVRGVHGVTETPIRRHALSSETRVRRSRQGMSSHLRINKVTDNPAMGHGEH